jgi:twinkle protein
MGFSWAWPQLTAVTYGRRWGDLVTVGAGTGAGKTTFIMQQAVHDLLVNNEPVGMFMFEQRPAETVQRLAGQYAGKTFHIPDDTWTKDELRDAVNHLQSGAGLYLFNHFGGADWNVVRERIRYLRHTHGVRIFYVDNLTALASGRDEREALEELMKDVGGLVQELGCWLLLVSHLATPEGKPHEEGGHISARHFKGSRAIMFWSHTLLGIERDQQADDPEVRKATTLRILKDRFSGRANGGALDMVYDDPTGRIVEKGEPVFTPVSPAPF